MPKNTVTPYNWNNSFFKNLVDQTGGTEKELSAKIGLSLSSFRNYYTGKSAPTVPALLKIADYFQVPMDILMGRYSEADYEQILKGNVEYMLKCRKVSYDQYLLEKYSRPDMLLKKDFVCISVYPYNLIEMIFHETCDVFLDEDHINGLNTALSTLSNREQLCLDLYFSQEMTYSKIGEKIGRSQETVRQIIARALRKLRHPSRAKLIKGGLNGSKELTEWDQAYADKMRELQDKTKEVDRRLKEIDAQLEVIDGEYKCTPIVCQPLRTTHINDMDLSVRSYNCLVRHFSWYYNLSSKQITLLDICDLVENKCDEVRRIRNLGEKSLKEILTILKDRYDHDYFYLYPELGAVNLKEA